MTRGYYQLTEVAYARQRRARLQVKASTRLDVKKMRDGTYHKTCRVCGAMLQPGDLYASSSSDTAYCMAEVEPYRSRAQRDARGAAA